jgi:hypothetical protein
MKKNQWSHFTYGLLSALFQPMSRRLSLTVNLSSVGYCLNCSHVGRAEGGLIDGSPHCQVAVDC